MHTPLIPNRCVRNSSPVSSTRTRSRRKRWSDGTQIGRLEHYPELAQRLREHLAETHRQEDRLDELLDGSTKAARSSRT